MNVTDDNNVSISASSGESYVVTLSSTKYAEVTVSSSAAKTVSAATSNSTSVYVLPGSSTSIALSPVSGSIDIFGKGAKGDKGDPGEAASGSSVLTSTLTVTNPIGAAEDSEQYSAQTDLQDIIREMLGPFKVPSVSSISPAYTASVESYSGGDAIKLGSTVGVSSVTVKFSDLGNVKPGSTVTLKYNNSTVDTLTASDYSTYNNEIVFTLSPNYTTTAKSSVGSDQWGVYFYYDLPAIGTDSAATVVSSSFRTLYHQKEFLLCTSNLTAVSSHSQFFSDSSTTVVSRFLGVNVSLSGDQEVLFSCDHASIDDSEKYVWVMSPEEMSVEGISIYTKANRGSWDATESFPENSSGISYTSGPASYNVDFYRSIQQRPLGRKNKIDINVYL